MNDIYLYGCLTGYYNQEIKEYQCITCKSSFIPIKNTKKCRSYSQTNLNSYCLEAENLGTEEEPKYSCTKCASYSTKIIKSENLIDCYSRSNKLVYCLEGENINELKCTKCVENSQFNSSNLCECDPYSFGKYGEWCYKCDDNFSGNPGCEISKGCKFFYSNNQLNCNQCKNNYFEYSEGQCYSCENEIANCNQCHFDNSNQKLLCDNCEEGFTYNAEENRCELINCEEHPEIYPGCIICDNQLEEYKSNRICHSCKPGYFKAKDNKCINCRSEKYGGLSCLKCDYEDNSENIKCKYCPMSNHVLTSDGKCYNCRLSLSENCQLCKPIKNENNELEKLECTLCNPGYYLNSKGECIDYHNYLKPIIPHCYRYKYEINNITFCSYFYNYYYYDDDYEKKYYEYYHYYSDYCVFENYTNSYNNYYHYYYNTYYNIYGYLYRMNNYNNENNYYYNAYEYRLNNTDINITIPPINSEIWAECIKCDSGYYQNSNGDCIPLKDEDCSLYSIIQYFPQRYYDCKELCYNNNYAYMNLVILNNSNIYFNYPYNEIDEDLNNTIYLDMDYLFDRYLYNNDYHYYLYGKNLSNLFYIFGGDLKYLFIQNKLCVNTSTLSQDFKNCREIEFIQTKNIYKCISCNYNYILDNITNMCIYKYSNSINNEEIDNKGNNDINLEGTNGCFYENIGTSSDPIYSCKKCYNKNNVLVTTENGAKFCSYPENGLENCKEANANTSYINHIYNCTSCNLNHISYYSKFFNRKICQNIYADIIEEKDEEDISYEKYKDVENTTAVNGICERNDLFTPDGKFCYPCNDEKVGMPGCKGSCSFSLKRNDILKCQGGCEEGYNETSEGICQPCSSINKGCYECHYEDKYPSNYLGIKRKRNFVCDLCESDYIKSESGKCLTCSDLGLSHCDKCEFDEQRKNYICQKCEEGYVLEQNRYCYSCNSYYDFIQNDKCHSCSDTSSGGIKGCNYCEKNNNQIICQLCYDGLILLKNNNTCLNRTENKQLEKFEFCEVLNLENNELHCSRCKSQFSLIKKNNKEICEYVPVLYEPYYYYYYQDYYYYHDYYYYYLNYYNRYYYYNDYYYHYYLFDNDYNYYSNYQFYPCQEASNLGTDDNPIYSCNKCYQPVEYDKAYLFETDFTKIINERNNINYCIRPTKQLYNCIEAINKTRDGIEICLH